MKLKTLLSASRFLPDGTRDYSYNYSYNYDPMGNPLNRTSQGQVRNYTANNLNQLATAQGPTATGKVSPDLVAPFNVTVNGQAAAVDPQGNWLANVALVQGENTITVEATDRFARTASEIRNITLASPPVFAYDANGNMTSDGEQQYVWNNENRLASTTNHTNDTKVENIYDGQGKRKSKKVFENETLTSELHFVYDRERIAAQFDTGGTLSQRFIWNDDQLVALEDLILGKTFYYFTDGNKNVTDLIDSSDGTIAAHYEYDPFGRIVKESGSYAATNPFRFSSEYFDKETGLVAYLFRDYAPRYARWLSRDPIGDEGFLGIFSSEMSKKTKMFLREESFKPCYVFCSNNAVNKWDKSGLLPSACYRPLQELDWQGLFAILWHSFILFSDGSTDSNVGSEGDYTSTHTRCYAGIRDDKNTFTDGRPCKCVSDKEIESCVKSKISTCDTSGFPFSNNCGTNVGDAFKACCLKDPTPWWLIY